MGNSKTDKTHYRKVFKSDHLGVADLEEYLEEGVILVFTIQQVKQHYGIAVAGRKGDHNIAYFREGIKPLVLNATNSKVVKSFNSNSPFVEDWNNTMVELYIDSNVKMKGDIVGGVRIRKIQPQPIQEKKPFTEVNFEAAHKANASIEKIKSIYTITSKVESKYKEYVTA